MGLANDSGGNDNITAVVVDVLVGEAGDPDADGAATTSPGPVISRGRSCGRRPRRDGRRDRSADVTAGGQNRPVAAATVPAAAAAVVEPPPKGKGPRRITFRVLLFLILLGGLAYGAWYVIKVYVGDSYFVGLQKNQLVIYQGRPGGFLGLDPKIVTHTGVTTSQVGSIVLPALRSGVQEPTRAAANHYVAQLVAAECSLENPPPSCATTATTTPPPRRRRWPRP